MVYCMLSFICLFIYLYKIQLICRKNLKGKYYIHDYIHGDFSFKLEIESLLKVNYSRVSEIHCGCKMYVPGETVSGKLYLPDELYYLDRLSILKLPSMAQPLCRRKSLFSLFGNKLNPLTLTVPNGLENNLVIRDVLPNEMIMLSKLICC